MVDMDQTAHPCVEQVVSETIAPAMEHVHVEVSSRETYAKTVSQAGMERSALKHVARAAYTTIVLLTESVSAEIITRGIHVTFVLRGGTVNSV